MERKNSATLSKAFRQGSQNGIPRGTFCANVFLEKSIFFSFLHIERNFIGLFSQCFWQDCRNFNLRVLRNILKKNIFFGKKTFFCYHFWKLSKKFSAFWHKSFCRFIGNAFYVCTGTFSEISLLRKKPLF